MKHVVIPFICRLPSWRRSLSLGALTAACVPALTFGVPALHAQHIQLAANRSLSTQEALLAAASSPQRFASFVGNPTLLAAAEPPVPTIDFTDATATATGNRAEGLPLSPSSLSSWSLSSSSLANSSLASSSGAERATDGVVGQFGTLNAKTAPKAPDSRPVAPLYTKYIPPEWAYQPIHGREKLILGARDLYSPANIAGFFVSAGYSHLNNGQPNYGTDRGAFGERLGAAALRETAQGILTDGVFAVMFHQDPRYFGEGRRYNVFHRALYAATRPIIVRTTNGTGSTVNSSLLTGYAAAAVLNLAYYPSINRNTKDVFSSYGGSLGGAALGFVVQEFSSDALEFLHLKHKP